MALKRTRCTGYSKRMSWASRLARHLPPAHRLAAYKAIHEAHMQRRKDIQARG